MILVVPSHRLPFASNGCSDLFLADVNKDHLIEKSEFRQVMGHGGLFLTNKDIDMLIDKFYANGAEFIDYEDFMGLIHGG